MKKTSLILFIAVSFIPLYAQPNINPEFLIKKNFTINGEPFFNYSLKFNADHSYTIELGVEGIPWKDSGTYEIKNKSVYMHCLKSDSAFKQESGSDYDLTAGNCVATLMFNEYDLFFTQFLEVKLFAPKRILAVSDDFMSLTFPVAGSEVPIGSTRYTDGFEMVTMGMKNGITIDNVKIRNKPSKSGKALKFLTGFYGGDELPSVPKGTNLTLIARTPSKEKIDKYEDYWYYVNVGAENGVWMYGAFIQIN